MDIFNIVSGICSIIGLIISIITLSTVINIYNSNIDKSKNKSKIQNNDIGDGSQVAGRDINERD